jgi:hypothetical protein
VLLHADKLIGAISGSDKHGGDERENGAGAEFVLPSGLSQGREALERTGTARLAVTLESEGGRPGSSSRRRRFRSARTSAATW